MNAIPTIRDHILIMQHMTLEELQALRSHMHNVADSMTPRQYAAVLILIRLKTPARAGKGGK